MSVLKLGLSGKQDRYFALGKYPEGHVATQLDPNNLKPLSEQLEHYSFVESVQVQQSSLHANRFII